MKKSSNRKSLIYFLILLVTLVPVSVGAQGSDPTDDEVNAIAKQLFCPVCENIPLDTCGTAACEQWRGIIRDKLAEGWTEEQIKTYFVNQYGDRVLAEPPARGFNWFVYIVPLVIFLAGGYLFFRGLQKWQQDGSSNGTKKGSGRSTKKPKVSDEYIDLVEEELRKRSKE